LAPLFIGITNQTKAFFAGRKGPGLFRLYADLAKLIRKSCPRPEHSTWIFASAQPIALASVLTAAIVFPWNGPVSSSLSLSASAALFFYLLGTGRIFTLLASLDAGSAFEGMGSSREVQFSTFLEPIIFIVIGFLVLFSGGTSLASLLSGASTAAWTDNAVSVALAALAFYVVLLSENCRVPFDDPETHLELTMIHEAMLLDVGGPDLAFALYGAALKFELLAAFLVMMFLPCFGNGWLHVLALFSGIALLSVATGVIESVMARMRFLKSPQTIMGAALVASLAVLIFVCF
jgi:formate hydrogenlyase subunit 4